MKTIRKLEKEIEEGKSMKFRNCIVCGKEYPLRKSDTKRYCSRKCSDIAMRVRNWEYQRGLGINELKAKLQTLKDVLEVIDKWKIIFITGFKDFGFPRTTLKTLSNSVEELKQRIIGEDVNHDLNEEKEEK